MKGYVIMYQDVEETWHVSLENVWLNPETPKQILRDAGYKEFPHVWVNFTNPENEDDNPEILDKRRIKEIEVVEE